MPAPYSIEWRLGRLSPSVPHLGLSKRRQYLPIWGIGMVGAAKGSRTVGTWYLVEPNGAPERFDVKVQRTFGAILRNRSDVVF